MNRRFSGALLGAAVLAALTSAAPRPSAAQARPAEVMNAAQIRLALARLRVVGSVLYIAAHPDDENTALLTYFSKGRMVRTAYLSATRGDGGQNLLGTETGSLLGVIRTQELMSARRLDGAEQYFTRALDFGFSKNPGETLDIWGHDSVLADMVRVIRQYRPDVILTRFPTTGEGGHGHHTASSILALEGFSAAADPTRFPEQLREGLAPWKTRRIFWNGWQVGSLGKPDPRDTRMLSLDVGAFNPLLGKSYTELAAESRSQHKSQGFGAPERRGQILTYFYPMDGDTSGLRDIFDGIDLTWARIPGSGGVDSLLAEAERSFDPLHPSAILPVLLRALRGMSGLGRDATHTVLLQAKQKELREVIRSCAGMWLEAVAVSSEPSPGDTVRIFVTALQRSNFPFSLHEVSVTLADLSPLALMTPDSALPAGRPVRLSVQEALPSAAPVTQPYWLQVPASKGLFRVRNPAWIGRPESPPAATAHLVLTADGQELGYDLPVLYRWTDPVAGERYRQMEVAPRATLRLDRGMYVFGGPEAREVRVVARGNGGELTGSLQLKLPSGWHSEPRSIEVALTRDKPEQEARFSVTPGQDPAQGTLSAELETHQGTESRSRVMIDYPHISAQALFPPATSHFVRLDLKKAGRSIGYLMGSGDQVPDALTQMGYQVSLLSDAELEGADLSRFDAIVAGVRAYNTRARLRILEPRLLEYVKKGGTLLVQYATPDEALTDKLGPYPFKITQDRVTVEEAKVDWALPDHVLSRWPNKMEPSDFDGWVQERGLYFANPADPRYELPLTCHDPGDPERPGGLVYSRYGQGVFIYTGYSFFRELPAGVPGALKLFVNMVSSGQAPR